MLPLYLSRLTLNPYNKGVRIDLTNPYKMHQTLVRGVDGQAKASRMLFRVEPPETGKPPIVLVQTHTPPSWQSLLSNGYLLCVDGPKTFSPRLITDTAYRFRLLANPVKKVRQSGKKHAMRIPLKVARYSDDKKTEDPSLKGYYDWLNRQAEMYGFQVVGVQDAPQQTHSITNKGNHFGVQFDGILRITDTEKATQAVAYGIGPAKAFGFGLLSVARSL